MITSTSPPPVSAAEFFDQAGRLGRCELLAGEVVTMPPAGGEHSIQALRLAAALLAWTESGGEGQALESSAGYRLSRTPDTVLAPDASWLCASRAHLAVQRQFIEGCPDLAIEIVSPSDSRRDVLAKVDTWLAAGTQVVWVVWPAQRELWVWRKHADRTILGPADTLTDALLPGFALPLARLFKE
ncbi:MAG: Uma2 family endonuclease [Fimbriimonadaceae bacterium]|nr:Uma2 family endonuclease [Fimbriimonadaceae bacterium]